MLISFFFYIKKKKGVRERKIPFASPVRRPWGEKMSQINGLCLGYLTRPENKYEYDISLVQHEQDDTIVSLEEKVAKGDVVISGESKNHAAKLGTVLLTKCLAKIPKKETHLDQKLALLKYIKPEGKLVLYIQFLQQKHWLLLLLFKQWFF
jgi:hypothetical protein